MKVETRLFGTVEIEESKTIVLNGGLIGFPDLTKFALIFDNEKEKGAIMWLQSLDEPQFAIPVITPEVVKPDYNPTVNDSLLEPLGDISEENIYVLVTIKVPADIKDMTVNLKAPFIINTDTLVGGQIIVEDDLPVRFPVYDILKARKDGE
ncbi:MAG: flagellar assembly protein FliW [Lachnospiraceae bacterium]|nr:flagellar assembly protein FliW [Lachnospiraceae bacterium]